MQTMQRIGRLRERMRETGMDALVVRDVRDLMWLTGFERCFDSEEAHTAVVTQDRSVLHTDSRYAAAMRQAAQGGEWAVDDAAEGAAAFVARMAADAAPGAGGPCIGIDDAIALRLFRAFESAMPHARFACAPSIPLQLRARKDEAELAALRAAQRIAEAAFLDTVAAMHEGMSEREASDLFDAALRRHGADGASFATIVASGPNGANPHAVPGPRRFEKGDLIVFDFGAVADGYCSDTTRMVSIGSPAPEQLRAFDAVVRANETVRSRLRPGVTGRAMHELALSVLKEAGYDGLMGHGLGHGVGLQIHEFPNLNARNDEPLAAGNVVTVEPGVYLDGRFGIRVEDCGVVTEGGFENFCTLSHGIFTIS